MKILYKKINECNDCPFLSVTDTSNWSLVICVLMDFAVVEGDEDIMFNDCPL